MIENRTPYEETKDLLDELNAGVPRGERWTVEGERGILAMSRKHDPFYSGQDYQVEPAEWFAGLFRRLGFEGRKVHLRFVHYVCSGEEPDPVTGEKHQERLPDGSLYENTDKNWGFIQEAAKYARNMGLVDPRSIIDRRTPRPFLNAPEAPPEPGVMVEEPEIALPRVEVENLDPSVDEGYIWATGYNYHPAHEPSLIEVWIEKSLDTEDDPLVDTICRELSVNLVTGIGFMTISSVYALLERRARLEKPLRVLYLSDFDPAGSYMPISPSRHIEFAIRKMEPKPDIRLHHLALTAEHVRELGLPRIPIKESDLRKGNFEAKYGEGATELNALMHPTRIDNTEAMLRAAILALRDPALLSKLSSARRQGGDIADAEKERRLRWPHRALKLIAEQAREEAEPYRAELEDMAARLEAAISPSRSVPRAFCESHAEGSKVSRRSS